ncbi:DUF6174 domain-containing protein [Deinococcus aerophilus]|nr:DUF6174 domain-containing protein [Deinococcus aerophilus]
MNRLLPGMLFALCSVAGAGGGERAVPVGLGQPARCAAGYVRPDFSRLQADLNAARTRWKAARVRNYRYDFARIAAPLRLPDVTVTVVGGRVQGIQAVDGQHPAAPSPLNAGPVEALFLEAARALTYQRSQPCATLRLGFDAVDGHPTTFYSGSQVSPMADGSGEWRVTNFSARP